MKELEEMPHVVRDVCLRNICGDRPELVFLLMQRVRRKDLQSIRSSQSSMVLHAPGEPAVDGYQFNIINNLKSPESPVDALHLIPGKRAYVSYHHWKPRRLLFPCGSVRLAAHSLGVRPELEVLVYQNLWCSRVKTAKVEFKAVDGHPI